MTFTATFFLRKSTWNQEEREAMFSFSLSFEKIYLLLSTFCQFFSPQVFWVSRQSSFVNHLEERFPSWKNIYARRRATTFDITWEVFHAFLGWNENIFIILKIFLSDLIHDGAKKHSNIRSHWRRRTNIFCHPCMNGWWWDDDERKLLFEIWLENLRDGRRFR